ncbi:RHS domain-containing protein [Diaphorobacter sp. NR2-3-3-1]|nr:RHS domain-containing protein [Diaphorobacter caeni]
MPQELANAQGQVIWQASYKTWGSTVSEEWEARTLGGSAVHPLDEGDSPTTQDEKQQNLRFQGQYLDRETGLHYNTFRYYDADVGRFACPDPIGLSGGINLGGYSPNPIRWVDPWGWMCETFTSPTNNKTLKVKNKQDLSHLPDAEIKALYHANNGAGYGLSPKNKKGEMIVLHHEKQNDAGPIIEMPRSAHKNGNKKLHHHLPRQHPTNPVN